MPRPASTGSRILSGMSSDTLVTLSAMLRRSRARIPDARRVSVMVLKLVMSSSSTVVAGMTTTGLHSKGQVRPHIAITS